MQTIPDYNLPSPPTLFVAGQLDGEPISLDPASLEPHCNDSNQIYIGTITSSAATRTVALRSGEPARVAVKVVEDNNTRPPRDQRREARLLAAFDHPNILALLNAYLLPPPSVTSSWRFLLFTPYYPLGLSDLLESPTFIPGPAPEDFSIVAHSLAWQLLAAVAYLHAVNVAHRDINPNNVVQARDGRLVLIDFGLSVHVGDEPPGAMFFEIGTGAYRAPELLFASRSYNPCALDLWAGAATVAKLFTPFATITPSPSSSTSSSSRHNLSSIPTGDWCDLDNRLTATPYEAGPPELRRRTLFDGDTSDFALIGSIFKVVGTPTLETWPEAVNLADFSRVSFLPFPPTQIASHLPYLDANSPLVDVLERMLRFSAKERLSATEALRDDRWENLVVLPKGVGSVEGFESKAHLLELDTVIE